MGAESPAATRRVLYASSLPPPPGGISTWMRIVLDKGLPRGYAPRVVDLTVGPERPVFHRTSLRAELRRALRVYRALLGELVLHRPRLLHVNLAPLDAGVFRDAGLALVARLFRVPVVIHHHGPVARLRDQPERRWQRWVLRRVARLAALNLVMTRDSLEYVQAAVAGGRARVESLPNFYDELALPLPALEGRGEAERPRVVFVGVLALAKGAGRVLEVAGRLPEVDFHLVGPAHPELEPLLRDLPPNAVVHGELDHAAAVRELAASHLLLFPSEQEGFPTAVLEAMVLGLPVVATRVGAIPEMIEEGKGGLLVAGEADALARAVRRLLADETGRLEMGRFNREKAAREYSFAAVSSRLADLYDGLLGAEPGLSAGTRGARAPG